MHPPCLLQYSPNYSPYQSTPQSLWITSSKLVKPKKSQSKTFARAESGMTELSQFRGMVHYEASSGVGQL